MFRTADNERNCRYADVVARQPVGEILWFAFFAWIDYFCVKILIMDFLTLAGKRYSCKKYSDRVVADEVLNRILEAGRLAPTAKNLQEQHIYIVDTPEFLAKIDECTPCRYGAPVVLVVAFNKSNVYIYPGGKRDSGIEDASIVATHLMLGAAAAGVDSCWLNCFDPEKLHAALGLPEDEEILMLLDLGYAAPEGKPLANHFERKPLSETVSKLR